MSLPINNEGSLPFPSTCPHHFTVFPLVSFAEVPFQTVNIFLLQEVQQLFKLAQLPDQSLKKWWRYLQNGILFCHVPIRSIISMYCDKECSTHKTSLCLNVIKDILEILIFKLCLQTAKKGNFKQFSFDRILPELCP